jgi:hypothetical protein
MDDFNERVRQRAYRLWVEEGCPEGRSDVHWDKARELVVVEERQKPATKADAPAEEAGGPAEPSGAVERAGGFPISTDQGEERPAPKRRRTAAPRASTKANRVSEPKQPKESRAGRR